MPDIPYNELSLPLSYLQEWASEHNVDIFDLVSLINRDRLEAQRLRNIISLLAESMGGEGMKRGLFKFRQHCE